VQPIGARVAASINYQSLARLKAALDKTMVGLRPTLQTWADDGQTGNRKLLRAESRLGAIITPSGVFWSEFVVHCLVESLLASEITFGGLNRCVSKQELNLLKFSSR